MFNSGENLLAKFDKIVHTKVKLLTYSKEKCYSEHYQQPSLKFFTKSFSVSWMVFFEFTILLRYQRNKIKNHKTIQGELPVARILNCISSEPLLENITKIAMSILARFCHEWVKPHIQVAMLSYF